MRVLILGGSQFIGAQIAETALAHGHRVTVFNRGQTGTNVLGVEWIRGDRNADLGPLVERGPWDVVFDTSAYVPSAVRRSTHALRRVVDHYVFTSTILVYQGLVDQDGPLDEDSPTYTWDPLSDETVRLDTQGGLKVGCERIVASIFDGHCLIVRPCIVVGPRDPTDRLAFWVRRIASGEVVFAPGPSDAPIQFIDARDLAAWLIQMAESRATGIWNAVGPHGGLTFARLLDVIATTLGQRPAIAWCDRSVLDAVPALQAHDFPLWFPTMPRFHRVAGDRAFARGLQPRDVGETIRDFCRWDASRECPPLAMRPREEIQQALRQAMRSAGA